MFLAVITGLYINTLDFRSESRQLVNAFHQIKEIFHAGFGPFFTGVYAQNSGRIRKSAFQGYTAFCFFQIDEFTMTAHKFILCELRIHYIFRQIVFQE